MKFNKTPLLATAAVCLLAFTGTTVFAQGKMHGQGMKEMRGGGFGLRDGVGFGTERGIIGILEAAGEPLTEEQIETLKAIDPGIENHDERMAALTPSQIEILETFREEHPRGVGGRVGRRNWGDRGIRSGFGAGRGIIGILKAAGDPLTEEQIETLEAIDPGIENHDERMAVLTPSQIVILETHRAKRWRVNDTNSDESFDSVEKALGIEENPEAFSVLKQNYPNPFNPTTSIDYNLAVPGNVRVDIYGPNGQLVETLVDEFQSAGRHTLTWNAAPHASGIYLCKIISGDFVSSVKMTYVK